MKPTIDIESICISLVTSRATLTCESTCLTIIETEDEWVIIADTACDKTDLILEYEATLFYNDTQIDLYSEQIKVQLMTL
jgi:hypothetical protein